MVNIEFIRIGGVDYDLNNLPSSAETASPEKAVVAESNLVVEKTVVSEIADFNLTQDDIAEFLDQAKAYAADFEYVDERGILGISPDGDFGPDDFHHTWFNLL